jgi:hypothetical protein
MPCIKKKTTLLANCFFHTVLFNPEGGGGMFPKHQAFSELCGVTTQKAMLFVGTTVRISKPTYFIQFST